MLTKRRIIVLAITGIMVAMITGGALMAQDGGTPDGGTQEDGSQKDTSTQTMAGLVAANLNQEEGVDLTEEAVAKALTDARMTLRIERFELKLQRIRDLLNLDDEQVQALRDSFESRLTDSGVGHSMHGRGHFRGFFGHGYVNPEAPTSDTTGSTTAY